MGAGHQKDQAMLRSLLLSAPCPILWRGLEIALISDHACVHEGCLQILKVWGS